MHEKLLAIQREVPAIKKDSQNPHFKNKYFDINTLLEVVLPILNSHGVVLLQGLTHINGKLALSTKLMTETQYKNRVKFIPAKDEGSLPKDEATDIWDKNDSEIEFICPLPECADAQKYGSAITYFRRYAIVSLLALEAEDDDGNTAKPQVKASTGHIKPQTVLKDDVIDLL